MQNKPNSPDTQMNATSVTTTNYNNQRLCGHRQNKPNLPGPAFVTMKNDNQSALINWDIKKLQLRDNFGIMKEYEDLIVLMSG